MSISVEDFRRIVEESIRKYNYNDVVKNYVIRGFEVHLEAKYNRRDQTYTCYIGYDRDKHELSISNPYNASTIGIIANHIAKQLGRY